MRCNTVIIDSALYADYEYIQVTQDIDYDSSAHTISVVVSEARCWPNKILARIIIHMARAKMYDTCKHTLQQ